MARTGTNALLFLFLMGCTSLNKQGGPGAEGS